MSTDFPARDDEVHARLPTDSEAQIDVRLSREHSIPVGFKTVAAAPHSSKADLGGETELFLARLGFDTVAEVEHLVREATVDDADALGCTHVRAWQAAYRCGLMPDEYLDGLDEIERAQMWRSRLEDPPPPRSLRLVGESAAGVVAGFILVGPAAGDPESSVGEVYAINVDPDSWGSGLGAGLIDRGIAALSDTGFTHAVLWVHPGNERARRFYAARGWSNDKVERQQTILEVEVSEVRYSLDLTIR